MGLICDRDPQDRRKSKNRYNEGVRYRKESVPEASVLKAFVDER
jgi:hypothetical protein